MIPAIGYIRVSMMLEEKISPDIQRTAITELARRRGYRIIEWVEDLDVSGRTFQRKIMKVIADVEDGTAKAILVWKYSRFGRNRTGNQLNLARVEKAGGELVSATEEIDARTAVGKLTRGVLFELAAFESDRAGEQWGEAFQNRLARGLPPLGNQQFGYIRRGRIRHPLYHDRTLAAPEDGPERYEPDHASGMARILADCYDRWIADRNFSTLADWANARGARTTTGAKFRPGEMTRMMDRGFAAGLICVHHRDCRCAKPSTCRNKEYHPGAHEAVISMETWETYKRLRKITSALPPRARRAVYPCTKLLRCGYCTHTYYPQKVHHAPKQGATWDVLAEEVGVSRRTIAYLLAWMRDQQLLVTIVTGSTRRTRAGNLWGLLDDGLGNLAAEYALTIPDELLPDDVAELEADDPEEEEIPWPCETVTERATFSHVSGHVEQDCTPAVQGFSWGGSFPNAGARDSSETTGPSCSWPRHATPGSKREQVAACERLRQEHSLTLGILSAKDLRSLLRHLFVAGFTVADVEHALNRMPDGRHWGDIDPGRLAGTVERKRGMRARIRHRVGLWVDADGTPLVRSASQQAEEAEIAMWREQERRLVAAWGVHDPEPVDQVAPVVQLAERRTPPAEYLAARAALRARLREGA
ncbi:recombinase family protein [Nonomuraea terrae]|uniref:Recombinase family protein n=1 Tax=Nonomuraea terrae TaxID=2530383 RepID=A0A4R4Z639_9ACTN|nr:recombinase family protein [Nonomuraea terrae]